MTTEKTKPDFNVGDRASWDGYAGTIHSIVWALLPGANTTVYGWRYSLHCDTFGSVQTYRVDDIKYARVTS